MSRINKVNPDHYTGAGRLSPDDLARERSKQNGAQMDGRRGRRAVAMPPWMTGEKASKPAEAKPPASVAEPPRKTADASAASPKPRKRKAASASRAPSVKRTATKRAATSGARGTRKATVKPMRSAARPKKAASPRKRKTR